MSKTYEVFGPRQDPSSFYSAVIPKFIYSLLKNKPPTIFGDGEQSRDFTYISKVVQADVLACSAPGVGDVKHSLADIEKAKKRLFIGNRNLQ